MKVPGYFSVTLPAILVGLFMFGGPFLGLMADPAEAMPDGEGSSRAGGEGVLSKIPNTRDNALRGVHWKKGTDEAFIVGSGAIFRYKETTGELTQIDGPESIDHYYEDIAWRPQGDYAIIVGTTPASTKKYGLIAKMWDDGGTWRVTALSTTIETKLTGVAWAPDGSYAVLVGGARAGESTGVSTLMLRFSGSSSLWTEIYKDNNASGLSDVDYNPAYEFFHACGLDGKIIQYDGDTYTIKTDNGLKNSELFSITWRDNGGAGIMGGWYGGTLKGHVVSTDGFYNRIETEVDKYVNDADWAPGSDYSLLVGQSASIWEYSAAEGLVKVENLVDTKHYFGVDFNDQGNVALIVGVDGTILRYDVTYPTQENFPPSVYITAPNDGSEFDHGVPLEFSSNGTNDMDLDSLDYEWTSSINGKLSTQPYFAKDDLKKGRHQITLTVDDAHGHVSSTSINITIRPPEDPPMVELGGDLIGYVGEDLDLGGKIILKNPAYTIQQYQWDFEGNGDWRDTLGPNTTNRYNQVGKYEVTMKVIDTRLAEGQDTITVTIFPKRSGDHNITINPETPVYTKDVVTIKINMSNAKNINVLYVTPGKTPKEYPAPGKEVNGAYIVQLTIDKNYKAGRYAIKWRYLDDNDNRTDWYEEKEAFTVKKHSENGNGHGNLRTYAVIGGVVMFIILLIVVVLFMMYKKSIIRVEVAILFYRDGRVMFTHTPAMAGTGAASMDMNTIGQVQQTIQGQIQNLVYGNITKISESMMFGNSTILVEQGMHTILAVAISGSDPPDMHKKMKNALQEIEIVYGTQLRQWDGLISEMPRIQNIIDKNISVKE